MDEQIELPGSLEDSLLGSSVKVSMGESEVNPLMIIVNIDSYDGNGTESLAC